jgi:hypothetical protein
MNPSMAAKAASPNRNISSVSMVGAPHHVPDLLPKVQIPA